MKEKICDTAQRVHELPQGNTKEQKAPLSHLGNDTAMTMCHRSLKITLKYFTGKSRFLLVVSFIYSTVREQNKISDSDAKYNPVTFVCAFHDFLDFLTLKQCNYGPKRLVYRFEEKKKVLHVNKVKWREHKPQTESGNLEGCWNYSTRYRWYSFIHRSDTMCFVFSPCWLVSVIENKKHWKGMCILLLLSYKNITSSCSLKA